MSIELMLLLFVLSVVLCGVGGALVKRWDIQVPRVALVIFHLVYISGLAAAFMLL